MPYGLTGYRFSQESDRLALRAWLSLIFAGLCFYLWLGQLGLDPIRSMWGLVLDWLPGLLGITRPHEIQNRLVWP